MAALNALLLSDGRPGHFRLAEGVLAAIARKRDVVTTRLEVSRRFLVPGRVVSQLVNGGLSPARVLSLAYGLDAGDLPRADVVVSVGGNTLGANIACARVLGASNIFYGSLRRFKAADFSLVLTSYAGQARADNQVMTLKPSAVDPDIFDRSDGRPGDGPFAVGLILGGNSGTVRYAANDWEQLFSFMDATYERFGTRWVVSNSSRTPHDVSCDLAARLGGENGKAVLSFIDVRDPTAPSLDELFKRVGAVVCTADSSSMLSECVWARKRVVAVMPGDYSMPDNEQGYRDYLSDNGWAAEMAISALTPEAFGSGLGSLTPLKDNPLDRLADDLARRLPHLFD